MAEQIYKLGNKFGTAQLINSLAETFPQQRHQEHRFKRILLDTFDWRLLNAGYILTADHHDQGYHLRLNRSDDQQLVTCAQFKNLPRFCRDLGTHKLARLLAPIMEMRALLSCFELEVRQHAVDFIDDQDKIQSQVLIESSTLRHAFHREQHADQRLKQLHHIDYRGYEKLNRKIEHFLQSDLALKPDLPIIQKLIKQLEIQTSYSTKSNLQLEPQARADQEAKQLLNCFFRVMQLNQQGIIDDLDTEFLHDFRIAVRCTRSLLSQIPHIFPPRQLASFQRSFAHLGTITSQLRDLDVMHLNFDEYRNMLPVEMHDHLEPAYAFVKQQRRQAFEETRKHLTSKTYQQFCRRWSAFLQQTDGQSRALSNAARPTIDVASERIWKLYKRSLKQGRTITRESPPDDLHTLRKTCKKLRYLIEFYQSLYDKKMIKRSIKVLKQLQDNLGEYQDLHVHLGYFEHLKETMQQQDQLDARTRKAFDILCEALNIRQYQARNEFFDRFAEFSSKQHQSWFKDAFKP